MPWCPKCRSEYRVGFSVCRDCDTKLVSSLDESVQKASADGPFEELLLCEIIDAVELSYIMSLLEEAKIPFRIINKDVGQYLKILQGRSFFGTYVYVRSEDHTEALAIVQSYKSQQLIHEEPNLCEEEHFSEQDVSSGVIYRIIIGAYIFLYVFIF